MAVVFELNKSYWPPKPVNYDFAKERAFSGKRKRFPGNEQKIPNKFETTFFALE